MINIGYGNYINNTKISAITKIESAPLKRQYHNAQDTNKIIDCTMGRKAASLIFLESDFVAVSARSPEIIRERMEEKRR